MGLYNNVKCEYLLPGAPRGVQNDIFQTKDFECVMDNYIITEPGELSLTVYEYYEVPEEERPHYGTPEWEEKPFYKLIGSMSHKFIENRKINHHGIIFIYTIAVDKEWWEYEIKFTDGKITNVKRVNEGW